MRGLVVELNMIISNPIIKKVKKAWRVKERAAFLKVVFQWEVMNCNWIEWPCLLGFGTSWASDVKASCYTSKADAKYGGGHESTGFMAIYKVVTGNRYDGRLGTDGQLNWEKLQKIQLGAHCTWAECRYSGFQMDEVIVYKNEQSTVWGLLELTM